MAAAWAASSVLSAAGRWPASRRTLSSALAPSSARQSTNILQKFSIRVGTGGLMVEHPELALFQGCYPTGPEGKSIEPDGRRTPHLVLLEHPRGPSTIVTASIDTTSTVWDINTPQAITQLIAHDREVYDVAWLPGSTDIFVSVGADGSLRAVYLRNLDHSTILYENAPPAPPSATPAAASSSPSRPLASSLLRIAFNAADSNYMATFHVESSSVQVLEMRSPGQPVVELNAHAAQVNALGWSVAEAGMLATAGKSIRSRPVGHWF
ncbi:WD40 repeat-like protein [Auricularia subglabra TFB-10046 SS5]|uniref:WD40 repeat-like protein n=1 Tax=Auricularia subglabra (strain TFB-10046 / SS5) TaxID=717982 RepID=J0WNZ0_AURST|nr:WD40 repeat-like protein [Auricularia subglabra TFB-10046 SS5]